MLKNIVNCKNCGAPLHYDLKKRIAICQYCKSEYHLDNLGIVEEYKVEIDFLGQRRKFYISSFEVEHYPVAEYCALDGFQKVVMSEPQINLELRSY